jgi:phospholipid/cholesterol/gamma-HCH transport system substrate-binding protein
MESKVNYALVGAFAIVLGIGLVVLMLWLAGQGYSLEYDTYLAYVRESVSGLSADAPVKYRGVDVGKVRDVRLAPGNPEVVKLTLDIQRGTPIKEDTMAMLSVQGVTGIAFLDLTGGSRDSPMLQAKPGEPYPVIKTEPSLFKRLDTTLNAVVAKFNGLAENANAVLDQDNRQALKNILANIDSVTSVLAQHGASLSAGLDNLAKTAESTSKVSAELGETLPRFANAAEALERMTQEFTRTGQQVNSLLRENRQGLRGLTHQTLPDFTQLITELRQVTGNLNRLTQLLERQPNALLFGRQAPPPGPGER